jgi:hypothetical protein
MARSKLTNTTNDLVGDGGAVLWSLVTGEQLEFPITLNFIKDATLQLSNNYEYEAVVIEADNFAGQTDTPKTIRAGGVQTKLTVRVPLKVGVWSSVNAYNKEEIVEYSDKHWKLTHGAGYTNTEPPGVDPRWVETTLNRIYVQFPKTLGATWLVKADVGSPVYGFFELRVTEPNDSIFSRTWKPVRGMVQLMFSPTEVVAD